MVHYEPVKNVFLPRREDCFDYLQKMRWKQCSSKWMENRNQFLKAYLRRYRGVSKKYLQGYVDFLSLLLNEGSNWYNIILSDNSPA